MKTGYIYSIVSKTEGTVYIGSTTEENPNDRKNHHYWELKTNIHKNYKLQRLYNKYSIEDLNFTIELWVYFNKYKELIAKEKEWISFIPEDYCLNIVREPEEGPMYNRKHKPETKIKISENLPDMSGSNNGFYGKHHTPETNLKNSLAHKGKIAWNRDISPSEESRIKMSNAHIGKSTSKKGKRYPQHQGENGPGAKLTWDIIKQIRIEYWSNLPTYTKLGKLYNIHRSTIKQIIFGKTWQDQEYLQFLNE